MDDSSRPLFVPLNRPEYPRNPESLLSALAWSVTGLSHSHQPGLVYEALSGARRAPRATRPPLDTWTAQLEAAGVETFGSGLPPLVAAGLLNGIRGVQPEKATAIAASPVVPNAAFLQNPVGMHAKNGPPNFASIVETIYSAGADTPTVHGEAAMMMMKAFRLAETQPVFRALNEALADVVRSDSFEPSTEDRLPQGASWTPPSWLQGSPTPFRWFHKSWSAFCQPEWREALPRRRWSDWASCLLRTGIAMSFLWEASLYRELGRAIAQPSTETRERLQLFLAGLIPLIEWKAGDSGLSTRDINVRLRRLLIDGQAARATLVEAIDADTGWTTSAERYRRSDGLLAFSEWAASRPWASNLNTSYGRTANSSANNLIETVTYLLQGRQPTGLDADFYGLLGRRKRRFLVVAPGLEWIVVVASVAAGKPGRRTNLKTVRERLRLLGIQAPREVVVSELERAGLARSSHDADDAIVVQSGF